MGEYSSEYLNHILECFIPDRTFQISPLRIGFINDTYMVLSHTEPQFILQRISHQVFKNVNGFYAANREWKIDLTQRNFSCGFPHYQTCFYHLGLETPR